MWATSAPPLPVRPNNTGGAIWYDFYITGVRGAVSAHVRPLQLLAHELAQAVAALGELCFHILLSLDVSCGDRGSVVVHLWRRHCRRARAARPPSLGGLLVVGGCARGHLAGFALCGQGDGRPCPHLPLGHVVLYVSGPELPHGGVLGGAEGRAQRDGLPALHLALHEVPLRTDERRAVCCHSCTSSNPPPTDR